MSRPASPVPAPARPAAFASAATRAADPWRAGVELGERLAPIEPDALLLFFTIHYLPGAAEFIAGLREMLGPKPLLCGGSGDGCFGPEGIASFGASALALRGGPGVTFAAALERGVSGRSRDAAEACVREAVARLAAPPAYLFCLADGTRADGVAFTEGVAAASPSPAFGGLTGDDRRFERGVVLFNDAVETDAALVFAAAGCPPPRLACASGFTPVGEPGRVTAVDGSTLLAVDGEPAVEFIRARTGKRHNRLDLGIVPLAVADPELPDRFALRSPSAFDDERGAVTLFGRIPEGATVRVCRATEEEILDAVDATCAAASASASPRAALVVSCAGRKWLLSESGAEEHRRLRAAFPDLPLAGFPSFGEIAPHPLPDGGLTAPRFHNETFVLALLEG